MHVYWQQIVCNGENYLNLSAENMGSQKQNKWIVPRKKTLLQMEIDDLLL